MTTCAHLAELGDAEPQPVTLDGCVQCLAAGHEDWVHLRLCLTCGNVGCCDSSPRKHASAHFHETAHPVMRSFEEGEKWRWCFVDETVG